MKPRTIRSRCTLKKTLLAASLLTAFGADFSYAQIITGGLYGNEPSAAGSSVVVTNAATGYRKEVQVDKNGRYSLDGLNPGTYTVTVSRDGKDVGSRNVLVKTNNNSPVPTIAAAAAATSTAASNAAELGSVEVTATSRVVDIAPIDVSTPTFLNHYDMQIVNQLPTGRSMESIALLRSNVVYDDQTTKLAVAGGATIGVGQRQNHRGGERAALDAAVADRAGEVECVGADAFDHLDPAQPELQVKAAARKDDGAEFGARHLDGHR